MKLIKLILTISLMFINMTLPTQLYADDMNENKLVLSQQCFELLSQTLNTFGEDIFSRQQQDVEYRYEIECNKNEIELYRFERLPGSSHYSLPRGGGDHHRTFTVKDGDVVDSTKIER